MLKSWVGATLVAQGEAEAPPCPLLVMPDYLFRNVQGDLAPDVIGKGERDT